jgi:N-acetylmuramic acid 6-phosphate etherase
MPEEVFDEIKDLVTEARNPNTADIDNKATIEILRLINCEDQKVAGAVSGEIPYIAAAVDIIVESIKSGGRLFYLGAGTSGRLGVLDASECPPTYGIDPQLVQGIIAGGYKSLIRSREGAEDNSENGAQDLIDYGFDKNDVLCAIAASQRTPYVIGAIIKAKELGGKVVYVFCNPRSELAVTVDVAICPVVGPEIIMGSTRMKAGTATKLILNMLTTTTMIRLGKVYQNLMVDLQMTSKKLEERAKRIVMIATGVDYEKAEEVLKLADGHVKTALVMILAGVNANQARQRLASAKGIVRAAIV